VSIHFTSLKYKNFLASGNATTEIRLDAHPTTLVVGSNGDGKCFCINTSMRLRNRRTGEIINTTIGDLYAQTKSDAERKDK